MEQQNLNRTPNSGNTPNRVQGSWKIQKAAHSATTSSLLLFFLSLSLFSAAFSIVVEISFWFIFVIAILDEIYSAIKFAQLFKKRELEGSEEEQNEEKKELLKTKISYGVRFGFKIMTIAIFLIWVLGAPIPTPVVYIPILAYYLASLVYQITGKEFICFRDGSVILWKLIRLVLTAQIALIIQYSDDLGFEDKNSMQIFWVGYVGLIIAIPSYIILLFYSLILKLASLFERKWKSEESSSFWGYLIFHTGSAGFLGLCVFIIDFFTYFSDIEDGSRMVDAYHDPYKTQQRKDQFTLFMLVFGGYYFLLSVLSIIGQKSIKAHFERLVVAGNQESAIYRSRPETTPDEEDPNKAEGKDGAKEENIASPKSYKFVKLQGDEYFKVVGKEELREMKQLDSVASKSPPHNKKHKASKFGPQIEEFDEMDINGVKNFQKRIQDLRERVAMGSRSVGPKFNVLRLNSAAEEQELGWIGSKELPKNVQRCISPDLGKISMMNQLGVMPEISEEPQNFGGGFSIKLQEMEDDVAFSGKKMNNEIDRMLNDDDIKNEKSPNVDSPSIEAQKFFKETDSVIMEKYKARKERLEKLMLKKKANKTQDQPARDEKVLDLYDSDLCVICIENHRDCIFQPCGHGSCCYECAEKVVEDKATCHYCREEIVKVLRIDKELEFEGMYKVVDVFSVVMEEEEE